MSDELHGPIQLPKGGIASDDELDKFSTLQHVRTKLSSMGIEEPMKPEFELPEVPPDISSATNTEIADLYSKMLAWDNYFSLQAAWATAELKEAKNKLTLITTKLMGGKKKKAEVETNEKVQEAKAMVQEIEQTAGILETTHKVFSSKLRMVSRTIEIRRLDWEKSARDNSIRSARYPHHRMGSDGKK